LLIFKKKITTLHSKQIKTKNITNTPVTGMFAFEMHPEHQYKVTPELTLRLINLPQDQWPVLKQLIEAHTNFGFANKIN